MDIRKMENERRKDFCPEHGDRFQCRYGNKIICCGLNCNFEVVSKRKEDSKIKRFSEIKTEFA